RAAPHPGLRAPGRLPLLALDRREYRPRSRRCGRRAHTRGRARGGNRRRGAGVRGGLRHRGRRAGAHALGRAAPARCACERLGRAFDRRLVGRLLDAARPHRSLIAGSLVLFPLIAAVELAQPYLLKIAIDDHILKSDWLGLTWIAGLYIGVLVLLYGLRWL